MPFFTFFRGRSILPVGASSGGACKVERALRSENRMAARCSRAAAGRRRGSGYLCASPGKVNNLFPRFAHLSDNIPNFNG
jgi:hypothetical protein